MIGALRSRLGPLAAGAACASFVSVGAQKAYALRIEEDVKLDFKDVLIRPKRSTLTSRAEVELSRGVRFKHSGRSWTGVPLMVANMDTVGTFEMAKALTAHSAIVTVHKHYSIDQWKDFASASPECLPYVAASAGTSVADLAKLDEILTSCPGVTTICIDVANGYTEAFVKTCASVRKKYPEASLTRPILPIYICHVPHFAHMCHGPDFAHLTRTQFCPHGTLPFPPTNHRVLSLMINLTSSTR